MPIGGMTRRTAGRIAAAVRKQERTKERSREQRNTRQPVAFTIKVGVTKAAINKDASGTCYLATHPTGATTTEIDNCFNPCDDLPISERVYLFPVMVDGVSVMTHYMIKLCDG